MNEKNKFVKAIKHPEWIFGVILRDGTGDRYED